jgi:hypothetical protein
MFRAHAGRTVLRPPNGGRGTSRMRILFLALFLFSPEPVRASCVHEVLAANSEFFSLQRANVSLEKLP